MMLKLMFMLLILTCNFYFIAMVKCNKIDFVALYLLVLYFYNKLYVC